MADFKLLGIQFHHKEIRKMYNLLAIVVSWLNPCNNAEDLNLGLLLGMQTPYHGVIDFFKRMNNAVK